MISRNDYRAQCRRCGRWLQASRCKMEWTGLFVCEQYCWERRNEQDKLKVPHENFTVHTPRPPHAIPENACSLEETYGTIGVGVVGCLIVGGNVIFSGNGSGLYN